MKKKKIFYKRKTKLVWGVDLKPEFPKKPDLIINNNFKKSVKSLSQELIKQL